MCGGPETVAKAVTLECMRSAHRQGRACYMYAFSGPSQVLLRRRNPTLCSVLTERAEDPLASLHLLKRLKV